MNNENNNQNAEQVHKHSAHHWWHMFICLAMIGAIFFLSYRGKNSVPPIFPQNTTSATESSFAEQRTEAEAVTIIAQPRHRADGLIFDLTFNTHSEELDFDVVRVVALIDANGTERAPREWRGDPAGGHHRTGTLFFDAVSSGPIMLLFRGIGGAPERALKWNTLQIKN